MYDAIPSSSSLASAATAVPEETDPEIDNFLPMLQEYLRGLSDLDSFMV